jgi:hypothetical protein
VRASSEGSLGVAIAVLLANTATLVCCVLPAALVSLGAGAVLVGLVSAVPQLIWMSERKTLVFGLAAGLLVVGGAAIFWARRQPCPVDPDLGRKCMRLRRASVWLYGISAGLFLLGAVFALILPKMY